MWKWLYGPILVTKSDRLGTYAAALAYCFVLSLIPFLVVTFTVGSDLIPGKLEGAYQDLLDDILPTSETGEAPGLGLTVGVKAGVLQVLSVAKESSGSRAGLMPGDQVLKIGGVSAGTMTANMAALKLKGRSGEKTQVTLSRPISGYPGARDVFEVVLEPPRDLSAQIIATLEASSHRGLVTVGFILAVYTSFNLMMQIVRTLLFIFDDPRRPQEWSWFVVLKTIALFLIWMFLLLLISIVSVVTPVIQSILKQFDLDSQLWTAPMLVARDLILMASLFGAFFLTYYLVPSKHYKWSLIRNGSLVASCGWVLCSLAFAYVLPSMWHVNAVYKALGSVVVILLWAQACAWSVIAGGCWIVRFSPRGK